MMPPPCHWIDSDDAAYLRWNYSTIATVRRDGQRYATTIQWAGFVHTGRAGSLAQGRRFIERWVTAQNGLPRGAPRR